VSPFSHSVVDSLSIFRIGSMPQLQILRVAGKSLGSDNGEFKSTADWQKHMRDSGVSFPRLERLEVIDRTLPHQALWAFLTFSCKPLHVLLVSDALPYVESDALSSFYRHSVDVALPLNLDVWVPSFRHLQSVVVRSWTIPARDLAHTLSQVRSWNASVRVRRVYLTSDSWEIQSPATPNLAHLAQVDEVFLDVDMFCGCAHLAA